MNTAARWLLVVDVTVEESVEDDWNRWYDEVHLPEIAGCPGFVSGERYVSAAGGGRRYLSLYEIDDPAVLDGAEFRRRRGWSRFAPHVQATVRVYGRRTESGTEERAESGAGRAEARS